MQQLRLSEFLYCTAALPQQHQIAPLTHCSLTLSLLLRLPQASVLEVLQNLSLSADVMTWTITKAIEESRAQATEECELDDSEEDRCSSTSAAASLHAADDDHRGGHVGRVAGAGRTIYSTRMVQLVKQCLQLMCTLPGLRVPIEFVQVRSLLSVLRCLCELVQVLSMQWRCVPSITFSISLMW
jgi:hypothetical protein